MNVDVWKKTVLVVQEEGSQLLLEVAQGPTHLDQEVQALRNSQSPNNMSGLSSVQNIRVPREIPHCNDAWMTRFCGRHPALDCVKPL